MADRVALTLEQQRAVEDFRALRGVEPFGPFVDLLASPELMVRVSALGEYLRYRSALPPRLSELAILITAAQWQQQFEWDIHAPIALQAGVPQRVLDALQQGRPPEGLSAEEQAIHDVCVELHVGKHLPAALRRRAEQLVGEQGVMDAIGLCGYYALLAMVLNSRQK